MNRALGIVLFLFAAATLISQTLMDVFASLFVLLALIHLYKDAKYREQVLTPFGWEKLIVLMIGFFAFSLFLGRNLVPDPSWQKLLDFRWIIIAILMGSYLRLHEPDRKHLLYFSGVMIFASAWAIMITLIGFDPFEPLRIMDKLASGTVRTGGFHKNPIVFAQLHGLWLSFFAGILVYQFPKFEEFKVDRKLYGTVLVATIFGTLAVLFSFTRGVWIAVPLALIVVLMLRKWAWGVASLVGLLALVVGLSFLWPAFESRITQSLQGGDAERLYIWLANFEMLKEHPWFGVGYSHNVQLLPEYLKLIQAPKEVIQSHAHNQWLHILVGTGIAGLLFYLAFWFFILRKSYQLIQSFQGRSFYASIATGCLAAFIAFQFGGLFESNYEHSKIRYTLTIITALLIWLDGRSKNLSK